ncbi:MAG: hypothetical protein IBJ09_10280 [Bacteroidia bacterium]|nr:hypothetical protein [Bacteroidia bacterium]
MKTVHLITLLEDGEKKELQQMLKEHKRSSLNKLYKYLLQAAQKGHDKENMFRAAFGEKYSSAKDYLLRNELRLLNQAIESLIIRRENEKNTQEITRNLLLLERMLQKGETELFRNVFTETERMAIAQADHKNLVALYTCAVDHTIRYKEVSVTHYEEVLRLLQLKKEALERYTNEVAAELELRRNFSLKVISTLDPGHTPTAEEENGESSPGAGIVSSYLRRYAASYMQSGEEKIQTYLQLIEALPEVSRLRPARNRDLPALYGNLALELFLSGRHAEADRYYTIALEHTRDAHGFLDLYFNYCVNALLLGKHKEVSDIYTAHFQAIDKNKKLRYRFACFASIACLMLDRPADAFRLLDPEIIRRPVTEYYYYRLVYAMVYFQKGDMDNAEREIGNILQSFRFRRNARVEDKPLVKLIQKMIELESFRNQKEKYAQLSEKLKTEVQERREEQSRFSTVIYNWIVWQVQQR